MHTQNVMSRKLLKIDLSDNPGLVGIVDTNYKKVAFDVGDVDDPQTPLGAFSCFVIGLGRAVEDVKDLHNGTIHLAEISLANVGMGPNALSVLTTVMTSLSGRCHSLLKLDISRNPVIVNDTLADRVPPADHGEVEQPQFWQLCKSLKALGCIEELRLNATGMGPVAAAVVSHHLLGTSRSPTVSTLHIHNNMLGRHGKLAMFPMLAPDSTNSKPQELMINLGTPTKSFPIGQPRKLHSHFVDEDWRAGCAQMETSDIKRADLTSEDAELLAKWMTATMASRVRQAGDNSVKMRLNLLGNNFGVIGGRALAQAFLHSPSFETLLGLQHSVTSLDLSGQGLHCGTMAILTKELQLSRTRAVSIARL